MNRGVRAASRGLGTAAVFILAACAGTAHYPLNTALVNPSGPGGYRLGDLGTAGRRSLDVSVSFSGGGTRAAALAYGVLEELAATKVTVDGQEARLLDEIDVISSVSGGSLTAAWFALKGDRVFEEAGRRFLYRDLQAEIKERILSGEGLHRLSSPSFGRIEIVAEVLAERLFGEATYGDLISRGGRPFVIVNATDMSIGARFAFTQDQFDLICSDLSAFPLARAVAASAAVPMVFSPLTLRNYADRCDNDAHAAVSRNPGNLPERHRLRLGELRTYLDNGKRPYIHLLDGGLVDNTGVWWMLDTPLLRTGSTSLWPVPRSSRPRRAVFVVVSAEVDPQADADRSPQVPSLRQVAQALVDIPINRASLESLAYLREETAQLRGEGEGVEVYLVEVSLRQLADEAERASFMAIPTSFGLPAGDIDRLRALGRRLLRESPDFRRLLRDLEVARPGAGADK